MNNKTDEERKDEAKKTYLLLNGSEKKLQYDKAFEFLSEWTGEDGCITELRTVHGCYSLVGMIDKCKKRWHYDSVGYQRDRIREYKDHIKILETKIASLNNQITRHKVRYLRDIASLYEKYIALSERHEL